MANKILKSFEKKLISVCSKKQVKADGLTTDDMQIDNAIEKTKFCLSVYDEVECTNLLDIFESIFLKPNNYGRTLLAIAGDVGESRRNLLRIKFKLLKIFACIYEKSL